jgi:hypothetical protein
MRHLIILISVVLARLGTILPVVEETTRIKTGFKKRMLLSLNRKCVKC